MNSNEVALSGELTALEALRYTPAGIPLVSFRLLHRSQQIEAGLKRQVECQIDGVALADGAVAMSRLRGGRHVRVSGFLNRKSRTSAQLMLHAIRVELLQEASHGDGTVRKIQNQG